MRQALMERANVDAKLPAAAKAPEEIRIPRSEMIKEPAATGEQLLRKPVVLEQLFARAAHS
jgi:hypothetical protein